MQAKKERIKVYIVIGLAFVAMVVAYFRFIHEKPATEEDATLTAPSTQSTIPQMATTNLDELLSCPAPGTVGDKPLDVLIRDVFTPLQLPVMAARQTTQQEPQKPVPVFELRGTIVGGARPMAIINDQFVRTDDVIYEYKVVSIGKTSVLLDSGKRKIELEMMK